MTNLDQILNELDAMEKVSLETQYLPTLAMIKVRSVLAANVDKYPDEKWKTQTVEEHLTHLVEHVADYQSGDKSEDWLAKIVCRAAMAAWKAEQIEQPTTSCECGHRERSSGNLTGVHHSMSCPMWSNERVNW